MKKWEFDDVVVKQMILGSTGALWGHTLEDADHFPVLQQCLNKVGH